MVEIKICGLTEPETVAVADAAGADWVGFVLVEKSPRFVTPGRAGELTRLLRAAVPVALLVDPDDRAVDEACETGVRVLQLHGRESPDRAGAIRARTGLEVWKALPVATRGDLDFATEFAPRTDRILLDAKPPPNADRTGGHGTAFDWSILDGWTAPAPWILAGGLTPDNVAAAIQRTGTDAVDVSSGVERVRGVKDSGLIKQFIEAAKA